MGTCIGAVSMMLSACDPTTSEEGIDPGVIEIPIAFIKRPIPVDDQDPPQPIQADLRDPLLFSSGGDVYLRSDSSVTGTVTNITESVTGGIGDVKGLNYSHDGSKLVFSLRLFDPNPNNPPFPTWNIYEYEIETSTLRPVISDPGEAELGHDLFPAYLPDGRIVFTSTRQVHSGEMRINEGKGEYSALDENENTIAMVLHVMNDVGGELHQISFNQSHDLQPQILSSIFGGQIVFSRWDNAAGNNEVNIYKVNPDGSELEILYGARSHATGTNGANVHFTGVREMANGDLMAIAKPFSGTFDGGDIVVIDVNGYVDIDKPVWSLPGLTGPAQTSATVNNVITTSGALSLAGRYSSAFPLIDGSNRILVSKSVCQLNIVDPLGINDELRPCIEPFLSDPAAEEASPSYSIWLYDMDEDTEKPVVLAEPGIVITEAIAVQITSRPPVIFDKVAGVDLDNSWLIDTLGVVNIRSVYDMGDTMFNGCFFTVCTPAAVLANINTVQDYADPLNAAASDRPARFVRFVKPVGIPDPDVAGNPDLADTAFGPQRNRGMREIIGYAPVEPDGSVKVRVPAYLPLGVEVLDAEGRRIGPAHNNWFQVQPGDMVTCVGCHDLNNGGAAPEAHGRFDAQAPSINSGSPDDIHTYPNTVIPFTMGSGYISSFAGQTLAEIRFDSVAVMTPAPPQPLVDPDLMFVDYWTDPVLTPDPLIPYSYSYSDLNHLSSPLTTGFCGPPTGLQFDCRVIINYAEHIHPIWALPRTIPDPADPMVNLDVTCTNCHTTAAGTQEAAGQLELTGGPSLDEANHLVSYRELLFTDDNQIFDAVNNVLLEDPTVTINPSMSLNGARRSYFMEKMTNSELDDFGRSPAGGTVNHDTFLTGAELKLISEWVDLGGQYFNNPFDPAAPQN